MADIAIRSLKKRYGGNQILHGVDLQFASGTFVVILGPSGCGKSTLLRLIAGLETITEGEIAINGRVVNRLPPRDRDCAMVFQNYALYPHMSVADNIGYSLKVAGVAKTERQRRIAAVAETLSLGPFLNRKPSALSGGQRQRVAMGRAMIREPSVFLFDEPLSNLDAQLRVQLRAEIRRLHKRLGVTSIFVTHDQVEAMTLADTLVVMNAGKVEQVGTPSEIYGTPATRFVANFVGSPAMNFIDGVVDASGMFRANAASWAGLDVSIGDVGADRRVAIGTRPETVDVLYRPEPGAITAIVDFVEELGSGRIVHAQAGGQTIAAAISHSAPEPGREIWLRIDPARLHAFCVETGVRLPIIAPSAALQTAPMAETVF